jgi:hypothetical protein
MASGYALWPPHTHIFAQSTDPLSVRWSGATVHYTRQMTGEGLQRVSGPY